MSLFNNAFLMFNNAFLRFNKLSWLKSLIVKSFLSMGWMLCGTICKIAQYFRYPDLQIPQDLIRNPYEWIPCSCFLPFVVPSLKELKGKNTELSF
jgi:hypothetical protein